MLSLEAAARAIDSWIEPSGVNGAAVAIWHRGEIAVEHYAGEARPGTPVGPETKFALASVTKPVTAATVLSIVEDGIIGLDESVARFVPEFGAAATGDGVDSALEAQRKLVTVRHLLAHSSGLPEDLAPGRLRYLDRQDLDAMTDAMGRLPLRTAPGTEHLYSNAGFAILGRVVERATGNDYWREAHQRIIDPLGLHDTIEEPRPIDEPETVYVTDTAHPGEEADSYNSEFWRGLKMPWGGLFGSARDLVTFGASFLDGGPRLLSGASIEAMTSDQVLGVRGGVQSMRVVWNPAFWGLGWEVKGSKRRHWTGELTSPRTFCHFGAAGTLLFADPDRQIAAAIFANRTTIHLWPFIPARWARLCNSIVAAVS
jgi:CubicO group peptidase (beta-lactamase class C family)